MNVHFHFWVSDAIDLKRTMSSMAHHFTIFLLLSRSPHFRVSNRFDCHQYVRRLFGMAMVLKAGKKEENIIVPISLENGIERLKPIEFFLANCLRIDPNRLIKFAFVFFSPFFYPFLTLFLFCCYIQISVKNSMEIISSIFSL